MGNPTPKYFNLVGLILKVVKGEKSPSGIWVPNGTNSLLWKLI